MEKTIMQIEKMMAGSLNGVQAKELHRVLIACLCGEGSSYIDKGTDEYVEAFLWRQEIRKAVLSVQ